MAEKILPDECDLKTRGDSHEKEEQCRRDAAKKAMFVVKNALGSSFRSNEDLTSGDRVASFFPTEVAISKDKEAFHQSKPILWTRSKNKSRSEKSQLKSYYSDVVIRKTGLSNGKEIKVVPSTHSENVLNHRPQRSQRPTLQKSMESNNSDMSYSSRDDVEKKKASSQKRSSQTLDSKEANASLSGKKSSKGFKSSSNDLSKSSQLNAEKMSYSKEKKFTKKENETQTLSPTKEFNLSYKAFEKVKKDKEKILRCNGGYHKAKFKRATAKEPSSRKKLVKNPCEGKDELKSKSENHVTKGAARNLSRRLQGSYSLIDVEKIKQKHSSCCEECIQARAKSAGPVKTRMAENQDDKKTSQIKTSIPMAADKVEVTDSSDEQLENSIVFFRKALSAVDLIEKLFQKVGSTKQFLQSIYDGLEDSSDVARCRRNLAEAREAELHQKNPSKSDNGEKKESMGKNEDENKSKLKLKKKEYSNKRIKKNGSSEHTMEEASLKSDHKSKSKREREKNLLELSDEWKKRNPHGKPY